MKRFLLLALCAAFAMPFAAVAQPAPPMQGGPPSPQQRAAMEKARADAKVAAYQALTPAHVTSVNAIVAQVAAGSLDRRTASGQIDALLTPDEKTAVMAAASKSFAAMRAAMAGPGGPPPPNAAGGPPPGPPGAGGPPGGGRFGPPSAGRFLLMVSMSRGQMRNTEPRARSSSAP
ncbi:MAG TPA: hypothetical protein VGP41_12505 [Candidatus Lustribacter sp.]|jgi:hypothetical protein|nr:hypothetical protein [Candidatus Lustribacter sp.]